MEDRMKELAKYRFETSLEDLIDAKLMLNNGRYKNALNRGYYSPYTAPCDAVLHSQSPASLPHKSNPKATPRRVALGLPQSHQAITKSYLHSNPFASTTVFSSCAFTSQDL